MKASSDVKLERKSSIESEPRTLSLQQLRHARETALYILNTKTLEEAISIFTEGLQPVLSLGHTERTIGQLEEHAEDADRVAEPERQSRLLPTVEEDIVSPFRKEDIFTAPF